MRVSLYQAKDGSYHKTFDEFSKHEERCNIVANAKSAQDWNLSAFESGEDFGFKDVFLVGEDIGSFVADNAALLRKILNDSVVGKQRGRKIAAKKVIKTKRQKPVTAEPAVQAEAA